MSEHPFVTSWHCRECEHCHTPGGCVGDPSPSDLWAGVTPAACDCDAAFPPAPTTDPRADTVRAGVSDEES